MAIGDAQAETNRINARIRGEARRTVVEPEQEQEQADPLGETVLGLRQALDLLAEVVESEEPDREARIAAAEFLLDQACKKWLQVREEPEQKAEGESPNFGAGVTQGSGPPEESMSTKMRRAAGYAA